jgi:hypothetical protein
MRIIEDTQIVCFQKNSVRRGFLALGSNGKTILGPREENLDHTDLGYIEFTLFAFVLRTMKHFQKC